MSDVRMTQHRVMLMNTALDGAFLILQINPAIQARRGTDNLKWVDFTITERDTKDKRNKTRRITGTIRMQRPTHTHTITVEGVQHSVNRCGPKNRSWEGKRLDVSLTIPHEGKVVARQFEIGRFGHLPD
jgi:hypothetical protein